MLLLAGPINILRLAVEASQNVVTLAFFMEWQNPEINPTNIAKKGLMSSKKKKEKVK